MCLIILINLISLINHIRHIRHISLINLIKTKRGATLVSSPLLHKMFYYFMQRYFVSVTGLFTGACSFTLDVSIDAEAEGEVRIL
jgi:hypothetical protein